MFGWDGATDVGVQFLAAAPAGVDEESLPRRIRPKMLLRVPEATHVGGLQALAREYEQRVTRFFDRALFEA